MVCFAGVTYADVAGIDKVKGDIQVAMDMLQGAESFQAVGAHPYRVGFSHTCTQSQLHKWCLDECGCNTAAHLLIPE